MDSKVSSDWLQSYVKATRPVLEIFKMAGYFPDNPRLFYTLGMTEGLEKFLYNCEFTDDGLVRPEACRSLRIKRYCNSNEVCAFVGHVPRNWIVARFPARARDFCQLQSVQRGPGTHSASCSVYTGNSFTAGAADHIHYTRLNETRDVRASC